MEKTGSPNNIFESIKPPQVHKLKESSFIALKFFLGICFLPLAYSLSVCFAKQLLKLDKSIVDSFVWGILGFLGFHLFVWEPLPVFKKGHNILDSILKFFAPLFKFAPVVLPIYTILIFLLYLVLNLLYEIGHYQVLFIFLIAFSFALHIVYGSRTLRTKAEDRLKANYIFSFGLIYSLDIILLAFLFNLAFSNFSFLNFVNNSYQITREVYVSVFTQLFL